MKTLALTQRVDVHAERGERRDALDQRWIDFVRQCGYLPLVLPNRPDLVEAIAGATPLAGVILTGGNDLVPFGGGAAERDETESKLVAFARRRGIPLLGVCRGMQLILHLCGVALAKVPGHVATSHLLETSRGQIEANSFHAFGAFDTVPELEVWARAPDGVIEAVRHRSERILGVMWHPERYQPFRGDDVALVAGFFGGAR